MLENKTILVTGGAGHVGSHIVDELLKKNVKKVIVYDSLSSGNVNNLPKDSRVELHKNDIRDYEDLLPSMDGCDYVFHTASVLLLEGNIHPEKAIDINIKGTYNVIKASIESGVKKVIFSSSASVYGDPIYIPVDEDHPYNSELVYGTTKIAGEHLFRDYYKSNKLDFVGLRYYNIYGPRIHYKGSYMQIVPKWVDCILKGDPLVIYGDGSQTMDMIYVTDVARANILALESDATNTFINIGTGKSTSVLQVAKMLIQITGKNSYITYVPQDVNLVKRRQCSTDRAKKLIGFEYSIDVIEGLNKYYDWRLEQMELEK
jgi:UDP-glucose 4-epimerase